MGAPRSAYFFPQVTAPVLQGDQRRAGRQLFPDRLGLLTLDRHGKALALERPPGRAQIVQERPRVGIGRLLRQRDRVDARQVRLVVITASGCAALRSMPVVTIPQLSAGSITGRDTLPHPCERRQRNSSNLGALCSLVRGSAEWIKSIAVRPWFKL